MWWHFNLNNHSVNFNLNRNKSEAKSWQYENFVFKN